MKPPKRMCEDPATPAALRTELNQAHEAVQHYQPRLDALRAAIAADALTAREQAPSQEVPGLGDGASTFWRFNSWPWGWKLALLGALGGGGAALGSSALTTSTRRPAATLPPPVARVDEPSVVPDAPKQVASEARSIAGGAPVREVDQLVEIRARLHDHPAEAYRLASELEREFPDGALSEEREALMLLALAKMGRQEEARRRARIFLARHPESTMRGAVRRVLKP